MTISDKQWKSAEAAITSGRVRHVQDEGTFLTAIVESSKGDNTYNPVVYRDGRWACGCAAFAFGNECAHLIALLGSIGLRGLIAFLLQPPEESEL